MRLLLLVLLPSFAFAAPIPFSWPSSGAVGVAVESENNGQLRKATHRLNLSTADGVLTVAYADFALTEFGGQTVTPEMEPMLAPVIAASRHVPSFTVGTNGQVAEMGSVEPLLRALVPILRDRQGAPPDAEPQIRQMLDTPLFRAGLRRALEDDWNAWAGAWVGIDLKPGETGEAQVQMPVPTGGALPMTIHVEHLGSPDGRADRVRLRMTTAYPPEAMPQMKALLAELSAQLGADARPQDWTLSASSVVEAVLDPLTGRPDSSRFSKEFAVSHESFGQRRRAEWKAWTFDWSATN